MDAAPFAGCLERNTSTISGSGLRLEQTLILEAPDQPGKLPLVLLQMGDEISQSRAGAPTEKPENLPLHVRQVIAALPEHLVLLRTEQMHNGVDGSKDVIGRRPGLFLDVSDIHAGHVDILNRVSHLEKYIFNADVTALKAVSGGGTARPSFGWIGMINGLC